MMLLSGWAVPVAIAVVSVAALQVILTNVDLSQEGRRRVQHVVTGQVLVGISYLLPMTFCRVALLAGVLLLLGVYYGFPDWYQEVFGPLLRQSERNRLPGAFWFLLGTTVTAYCFEIEIGRYAVLALSYADPMAAYIGMTVRSPRIIASASLAGSLACFSTAYLLGYYMLNGDVTQAFVGALVCTLSEAIPLGNDNLLIPVATAASIRWVRSSSPGLLI